MRDLPAVPLQVRRQDLALQRVMDRLVAPFHLVPLEVDEHVRQAGDDPHEQRGQAAKDPRGRPRTSGRAARQEETDDDGQVDRPRGPPEQALPERKPARMAHRTTWPTPRKTQPISPSWYRTPADTMIPASVASSRYEVSARSSTAIQEDASMSIGSMPRA